MKCKRIREENDSIKATDFANIIYNLRVEHNLTQKELADKIQVSDRTISKWENGQTVPDLINIKTICDELGVSPSSLVNSKRTMKDHFRNFNKHITKIMSICFRNMFFIFFIISFILLLIYFINNYNSMSIYLLKYDSEDINIGHGYFVESKTTKILVIDDIKLNKINYEPKDIKLELYTFYEGDKNILFSSNNLDDIYIDEYNAYPVIFTEKNLTSMKNNIYLEINFLNEQSKNVTYKSTITLNSEFSNNKLSYNINDENESALSISNDYYYPMMNNIAMANFNVSDSNKSIEAFSDKYSILEDLGFVYDDSENAYVKEDGKDKFSYSIIFGEISYEFSRNNLTYKLTYKFDSNRLHYKIYKNKDLKYNGICTLNDIYTCDSELIEKNKIDYLLSNYTELNNSLNVE